MTNMQFMQGTLLLLLLSSSCLVDGQQQSHQQSVQPEQSHSAPAVENTGKTIAGSVDKNKRDASDIPVVVGAPAQHSAYINHHVAGPTVVAAPISGHATHAALSSVPFGYGHAVTGAGHILQTSGVATGPQHVIHKVNYVAPVTATTLKLATVSEGHHVHLPTGSSVVTKYNYAVPQLTYAHYPQYQVYHHQVSPGGVQPGAAAIYTAHQLHEHPGAAATVHEVAQQQPQQHTAYAHQQPIYAHHPAAIHYSVPTSLVHAGQHNYQTQQQQQQQQHQVPLSHTQAIHYQAAQSGFGAAGQPAVPIVHQTPIATINQVHQAQQVYATQGQLTKYPLAGQSLYGAAGPQNPIYSTAPSYAYHQHTAAGTNNGLIGKQLLPTVATPVHLKSLVPVTTTTSTQHHGNGISYTAFTQPSHPSGIQLPAQLKPVPQSVLQTQQAYYNTGASSNAQQQIQQQPNLYYRSHLQQQQQQQQQAQQQQRIQIYSTAATPLQKAPVLYSSGQFSHPVPSQYAAYAYGPQQSSLAGGLFQPQAGLGKITYAPNGGAGVSGGRGSIYLLH